MNAENLIAEIDKRDKEVEAVTKLWGALLPDVRCPNSYQLRLWLDLFQLDSVVYAIRECARKFTYLVTKENVVMDDMWIVKFVSKTASAHVARRAAIAKAA